MTEQFSEPTLDQLAALHQNLLPKWQETVENIVPNLPSRRLRKEVADLPHKTVEAITEVLDDGSLEARVSQRKEQHLTAVTNSWRLVQKIDPRDVMSGNMQSVGGGQDEFSRNNDTHMSLAEFEHSAHTTAWRQIERYRRASEYVLAAALEAPVFYEVAKRRHDTVQAGLESTVPELVARYLRGEHFNATVRRMDSSLKSLADTQQYPRRYHGVWWTIGRFVTRGRWDAHGNMQEKALFLHAQRPLNPIGRPPISDSMVDRAIVEHFSAETNHSTFGPSLEFETSALGLAGFAYRAYSASVDFELKQLLRMDGKDITLMRQNKQT